MIAHYNPFCALNHVFLHCNIAQACRERIRALQSKITAFTERVKLVNQRATPDAEPLQTSPPPPLETHFA